jgi:hypothetical protein
MDSPSRSEISTEGADIRRVEFVDGRVVHLPNRMPEERVMLEVRSSQQDLQLHPSCTPIPNFLCVPPPFPQSLSVNIYQPVLQICNFATFTAGRISTN